jgi:hypothetical protein
MARFGKAARHPLCLAALELWALDEKASKLKKDASSTKEVLNSAGRQRKQVRELFDQFYKERKEKEAIEADVLYHKINEHLLKARKAHEAQVKLLAIYDKLDPHLAGQFERELRDAKHAKDASALKALPRVQKRWEALSNGERLKYSEARELEILQMLRGKTIQAKWATGKALAGYTEAAFGGDRPLSDDEWQGRLTAREIHSHLKATKGDGVAGDKDAKEVRRSARRIGIRLDEDQRGRKWKEPAPKKQKQGRPRGRPRVKPKLLRVGNLAGFEEARLSRHRVNKMDSFTKRSIGEDDIKIISQIDSYGVEQARKETQKIESEIRKLQLARGGRKGLYVYD